MEQKKYPDGSKEVNEYKILIHKTDSKGKAINFKQKDEVEFTAKIFSQELDAFLRERGLRVDIWKITRLE